jgi:ATPase subunit of ABC transporter with duplicated ATPase domains
VISLSGLGKSFGDRTLFADVTLRLDAGNRYGLVGANGSGKTTLMHMLSGNEPASDGEIIMRNDTRIGVLEQDRYLDDEQTILDVAMMGDRPVWQALRDKERLLTDGSDAVAIADIEDRILSLDGYTLAARAGAILEGLGIADAIHHQPLGSLSGGFKLRVLLTQTLVASPDVMLLDEPTNHLDILTIRWLEEFLASYKGCAVVISHDHRFLDNVASHIVDVDYETITLYPGNYSRFIEAKRLTRERKEAEIGKQQQEIAHKRAFVDRMRAKATKARQAQSRLKQIERIKVEELAQSSRRAPSLRFEQQRKSGRDVLSVQGLSKAFGDNVVLTELSLTVRRGEKIAVIGANGLGKSTLLKILVSELDADEGAATWGYETNVGYFPQDHSDLLEDPRMMALDYLWSFCPQETTSFVRGQLGRLLFSGEDVEKKLGSLSGGESARLIFSRLLVQKPNVLLLDEPTNHLDLESIEALADALDAFEGTMLLVSHDRWFVSRLANRILELTPDGVNDYPGSYQDYLNREGRDHLDADAVLGDARQQRSEERATGAAAGDDWEEQKRRRGRLRKLESDREKVTVAIERGEARMAEIQQIYCQPGFFEQTPKDEVSALEQENAALAPELETLMAKWEAIETELEELSE